MISSLSGVGRSDARAGGSAAVGDHPVERLRDPRRVNRLHQVVERRAARARTRRRRRPRRPRRTPPPAGRRTGRADRRARARRCRASARPGTARRSGARRASAAPRRRCSASTTSATWGELSSSRARSSSAGRSSSTARTRSPATRHAARTPARNFGRVIVTVGARAERRIDLQAVVGAEGRLQPRLDVGEPDAAALAGQDRAGPPGLHAHAVVGHPQLDVGVDVAADDLDPPAAAPLDAVAHRVLHQRLERQHGDDGLEHLGGHLDAHLEPIAEAGALEPQVLLHVAAARRPASRRGAGRGTRSA